MINTNGITLFALVVEAKSFNKAAKLANISPAALSKKISQLEKELKVQLLNRTTRQLHITEAGELLYQHAKKINEKVNDAFTQVTNFSSGLMGTIKMTVPVISGELLLAEVVAEFCQRHQHLSVDMRLENEFVDLVKEGRDIAIRTGELTDSTLIAKRLIESNWVVCCSPRYIEKYGKPQSIEELTEHNCFAYTYQSQGTHDWKFEKNNEKLTVKISGNFASDNSLALRKAILAGYGIAYVPKFCLYDDIQSGALVPILQDYKPRSLGIYAVYPYTKHQSQKIKLLIEHIKDAYQQRAERFK
ncbi:MAG: LysR family transcriptional regulator [Colwellia sp.]